MRELEEDADEIRRLAALARRPAVVVRLLTLADEVWVRLTRSARLWLGGEAWGGVVARGLGAPFLFVVGVTALHFSRHTPRRTPGIGAGAAMFVEPH